MSSAILAEMKSQVEKHGRMRDYHERLVGIYEDAVDKAEKAFDEFGIETDDDAVGTPATAPAKKSRSEAMKQAWATRRKNAKKGTAAKTTKKTTKKSGKRAKNDSSLADVVQGVLRKTKDGLKLADLVEAVVEAGWTTTSKRKGGLSQIVYQCVNKLMNTTPKTVVKDKDSKRYRLRKAA